MCVYISLLCLYLVLFINYYLFILLFLLFIFLFILLFLLFLSFSLHYCFPPWVVYSRDTYIVVLTMSKFTLRTFPATVSRVIKPPVFSLKRCDQKSNHNNMWYVYTLTIFVCFFFFVMFLVYFLLVEHTSMQLLLLVLNREKIATL